MGNLVKKRETLNHSRHFLNMAKKVIALFDVDGTLTVPRKAITQEMHDFMQELKNHVTVGIVGGSDYKKITEQLGACSADKIENLFPYVFSENGLVAFGEGQKNWRNVDDRKNWRRNVSRPHE